MTHLDCTWKRLTDLLASGVITASEHAVMAADLKCLNTQARTSTRILLMWVANN